MKLGDYTFKRKYSLIQIIVDIASVAALIYIILIVLSFAGDIERIKEINDTDKSLEFLKWQPLLVWCILGALIWVASVLLLVRPHKIPKKYVITEKYAPKYCSIIDACISCTRLMLLMVLSELCYMHRQSIMLQDAVISVQLIFSVVITLLLLWFTAVRLDSLSRVAEAELEEEKPRTIIEN